MPAYELIFVLADIGELGDPRVDVVEAELDAVFERHGGLCLVTATIRGADARSAAVGGVGCLRKAGFTVLRSYPDLVNRAEIADRLNVTRQAVGNWIRGERLAALEFPVPVHLAANGLWLWGDVVDWHCAVGHAIAGMELRYPSIEDHAAIDGDICTGRREAVSATRRALA